MTRVNITKCLPSLFSDPCLVHYCGRGEECVALGGVARCICVRKCGQAKRRVCGTDGQLYDNRCELHKAGCLTGVNIEIDHSLKCFIPSGEFKITSKHRLEVVYYDCTNILCNYKNTSSLTRPVSGPVEVDVKNVGFSSIYRCSLKSGFSILYRIHP